MIRANVSRHPIQVYRRIIPVQRWNKKPTAESRRADGRGPAAAWPRKTGRMLDEGPRMLGDKYEPVKRIGHGSYGSVYLARPKRSRGGFVVLKRVFVVEEGAKEHREAINEVKLLQRLRHKNIVAYRDSF
ncbi:MAG: protein kinase domain-containing protein, partial [Promethearchaeia archaeon]